VSSRTSISSCEKGKLPASASFGNIIAPLKQATCPFLFWRKMDWSTGTCSLGKQVLMAPAENLRVTLSTLEERLYKISHKFRVHGKSLLKENHDPFSKQL
jgi:hypothetical protein